MVIRRRCWFVVVLGVSFFRAHLLNVWYWCSKCGGNSIDFCFKDLFKLRIRSFISPNVTPIPGYHARVTTHQAPMALQETFESQIACEPCMPLDDVAREVAPLQLNETFVSGAEFL